MPLAVQNSLIFRDGSLEFVWTVTFLRIKSIWIVTMLIVDLHVNIGKNWVQNVVYMNSEMNWNLLLLLLRFYIHFNHFSQLLFLLLCLCKFPNHDPWQKSVSKRSTSVSNQRNSSDPFETQTLCSFHRLRYSDRFLVQGRQDIGNYWDFPAKVPGNCHERLVPKITRHD